MNKLKYIFLGIIIFINFIYASNVYINKENLDIQKLANITSKSIGKVILLPNNINAKVNLSTDGHIDKSKLIHILNASLLQEGYKLIYENNIYMAQKINNLEPIDSQNDLSIEKYDKLEKQIKQLKKTLKKNTSSIKNNIITDVVHLQNAKASSVQKALLPILNKKYQKKQNDKLYISSDDESNSVILMGPEEYVLQIKNIISKLDDYRAQVYVQAKIIEISESKTKDVGLKYGLSGIKSNQSGLYTLTSALTAAAIPQNASSIGLSIPNISSGIALGASINLLNLNGALDIVSQPSLLCINNKESSIYIGQTKSLKMNSQVNNSGMVTDQSFTREDIGLRLKIKPRISNENKVMLEIDTLLEDIRNSFTNGQPDTTKKEIKTTAIVNSGESVIIGGLIKTTIDTTEDNVAGISKIPLFGDLFKSQESLKDKINLVVIVTPYIIPRSKDLTYIQNELSKLKQLEDKYTEDIQNSLNVKDKGTIQ